MVDQILFLFDLDQLIPLEGSIDEVDQECRLNCVKEACLRIFLRQCDVKKKEHNLLPHFGYRFFSSTGYHRSGDHLPGHFQAVTYDSVSDFETALDDKFRTIIQNAIKYSKENRFYYSAYLEKSGHKGSSEKIKSCLEESLVLFDWDRPTIVSPVKLQGAAESDEWNGNQIYLVTRIPRDRHQFQLFLPNNNKVYSHRDFAQALFSKKTKSMFSGYLKICLNVLDTSGFFVDVEIETDTSTRSEFEKSIKSYKGSVIPVESLSVQTSSLEESNLRASENIVQCGPQNSAPVPSSVYLKSFLITSKSKVPDIVPNSLLQINLGGQLLDFECSDPLEISSELQCKGYIYKYVLTVKLKSKVTLTVTSESLECQSLLQYLYTSNRVAVIQSQNASDMLLLSADSLSAGSLQHLQASDANFLSLMFRLKKLEVEPATIPEGGLADYISTDFHFVANDESMELATKRGFWDANALETWRRKDTTGFRFLRRMKEHKKSKRRNDQRLKISKLRQRSRECYSMKEPSILSSSRNRTLERRSSEIQDRLMHDFEPKESRGVSKGRVEFQKHLSEISNVSSVSLSSRSSGIGTWSSSGAPDTESDVNTAQLISQLKSNRANAVVNDILESVNLNDNDELASVLEERKRNLVENIEEEDPLILASFAESCVSLVLKHLDSVGIPKTNLEEFVTEHLLMAVNKVSSLYSKQKTIRIREHQMQVLLRVEVYWLLANQTTVEKFEESMLEHLRQISFHDSPGAMANFLRDVLLPCNINRQDSLLCFLYDELDQDRPGELNQIFSPEPCSTAPSSNTSLVSSVSSVNRQDQRELHPVQKRIPMARHKSFDTNLTRQINMGAGLGGLKKSSKQTIKEAYKKSSRAVPTKKVGVKEKTRQAIASKRESARKNLSENQHNTAKSPTKKAVHQARRNLCFDKSPMKKISGMTAASSTTPTKKSAKSRQTPQKLTPGKRHRIMVPVTPTHKNNRRKSDGNRSIVETPDKGERGTKSLLSKSFGQKSSFYSDNRSRNAAKYEESLNASLLSSTVCNPLFLSSEVSHSRKSINIFSQIMPRKRKRDSTDEDELDGGGLDISGAAIVKMARLATDSDDSVRTRKRRISFSDEKKRTIITTPSKLNDTSPEGRFGRTTPRKNTTPSKIVDESPYKKVTFNRTHMSATPRRSDSFVAKGILKTPSKTPNKDVETTSDGFCKPTGTPSRATARILSYTPKKSPAAGRCLVSPGGRRDISSPGRGQTIRMLRVTQETSLSFSNQSTSVSNENEKLDMSSSENNCTPTKLNSNYENNDGPLSPIVSSSKKRRKILQDSLSSESSGLHGFATPSPGRFNHLAKVDDNMTRLIDAAMIPDDDSFNKDIIEQSNNESPTKLNGRNMDNIRSLRHSGVEQPDGTTRRVSRSTRNSLETSSAAVVEESKSLIDGGLTENSENEFATASDVQQLKLNVSNIAVPIFNEQPGEVARRTSPRKNNSGLKRRPSETSQLDDKLAQYFSPKSSKREVKVRQDVQDNIAIANAIFSKSPRKNKRRSSLKFGSKATEVESFEDVKTICDSSEVNEENSTGAHERQTTKLHVITELAVEESLSYVKSNSAAEASITTNKLSSVSLKQSNIRKLQNAKRRVEPAKPIENPESDLAFNASSSSCDGNVADGFNSPAIISGSNPQTILAQNQSCEFYECSTCQEKFELKTDYMSHHMMCLLKSNTGVLFDKVREKSNIVVEEEPKVSQKKDVKEKASKKKVESKSRSKKEQKKDIVEEPIKDTNSKPKKRSAKTVPVKVEHEEKTPISRNRRSRNPVSYEETSDILDVSNSFTEDGSSKKGTAAHKPEFSQKTKNKRKVGRFVLDGTKRTSELISTSTPVQNTPRGKVNVKIMNTSQDEITDLDSTQSSVEQFKSPSPDGRGKFFSIGKLVETPDGRFKINLNRVKKPSQADSNSSTPTLKSVKQSSSREGSSKKSKSSSSKSSSPAVSTPLSMYPIRISRSAAKEVGVSPSKLNSMIWDSPKRRPKDSEDHGTPGKENAPQSSDTPRTPKLLLKRTKTLVGGALSEKNDTWVAETVISPVKAMRSPVKFMRSPCKSSNLYSKENDEYDFPDVSPVKDTNYSPWRGSPASLRTGEPGSPRADMKAKTFSPLTSTSMYKLQTSPLIQLPDKKVEKKTRKVNKQLNLTGFN